MNSPQVPLLLPLNRPQYVPSAETLISALAWDILEAEAGYGPSSGRIYQVVSSNPDTKHAGQTRPEGDSLVSFARHLEDGGLRAEGALSPKMVATAVLNGIAGVRPTRAKVQAASPLTPALALLQDSVGMTGVKNPVNYASILETMFVLGAPEGGSTGTMAGHWLAAARRRLAADVLLQRIEKAFVETYGGYSEKDQGLKDAEHLRGAFRASPFGWLHDSWVKLTSDDWVDALPPRVWVDWATTVLRMGLAFGFLWEAERYRAIFRAASEGQTQFSDLMTEAVELLPWPASYLPPATRSVRPAMRRRIDEGGHLRILFANQIEQTNDATGAWLDSAHFITAANRALTDSSRPSSLKNVYETVFYSLVRRDESDHYGLLVRRGTNVTLTEPGTEWVAMMAGLTSAGPGRSTQVGRIIEELSRLGLQPPLPELVRLLEAAGLARGSADADHGVRVANPYGEGEIE